MDGIRRMESGQERGREGWGRVGYSRPVAPIHNQLVVVVVVQPMLAWKG